MLVKILSNDYFLNFVNKVFSIAIGVVSSALLARYLGVVARGEFAYVLQISVVLTTIFSLGLHQSYSYFYKKEKRSLFQQFVTIYAIQFFLYILIAIVCLFIVRNRLLFYIALLFPFNIIYRQLEGTMAVENIRAKMVIHILSMLIRMLLYALLFLFFLPGLIYPIIVTIIITVIEIIYFLVVQKTSLIKLPVDLNITLEALKFSFLPMITSLLVTLNYSVDIILLKHLGNPVDLGIYSTAAGIINYFWLIPDSFRDVLLSRVSRSEREESTQIAIKISVWAVVCVAIVFSIIGYNAIILLYGMDFSQAYYIVLILSIGIISMVYYKMIGVVMVAEGNTKQYFLFLLLSVIVNIIANVIAIPLWGMYGAALASVLSYTLCGLFFFIYYAKKRSIRLFSMIVLSKLEIEYLKKRLLRR